jgi:dephospho-CoA kinase
MGKARQTRKSSGSRSEKSNVKLGTQGQLLTIVGMPGAGKSVVVDHLRSKGWLVVHFGAVTMRELERRGLVVNESNERFVREDLRKKHGMAAFAKLSMREVLSGLSKGPTVIDGLYSWSEYKFLRNQLSERFFVVNVFTSRQIRYDRLLHREVRPLSHEEAEARDFAEIENLEKGGPIAMADFTLQNDETMEKLHSEIDKLLELLAPS